VRYADAGALFVTVLVAAGPVVLWLLPTALNLPAVTLAGNVLPGMWLAAICALALRRRTGPLQGWPPAADGRRPAGAG
jgi:hypothetical protein